MAGKIGKSKWGGWLRPSSTLPLSNFWGQEGRSDLKKLFMNSCPKDEATAKLFCLLLVIYYDFWSGRNIVPSFWLKFDNVTVTLYLIVLS